MKRALLVAVSLIVGCGSSKPVEKAAPPKVEPVVEEAPPPAPTTYVIVHRNTPIRLRPEKDAPYLQYRTPERQQKIDEREAEQLAERDEKWLEEHEEWWEREKERRVKLRRRLRKFRGKRRAKVRERDLENQEKRVDSHYYERLREVRRDAMRNRGDAPHRQWIPFRLLGREDGWVELSPVAPASQPPHCYRDNFGEVDRLDATFFVREDNLELVTTRSVTVAPMQGTEVILRPGVAVRPLGGEESDKFEVFVGGFVLELPVPRDAVGHEYEPQRPFEAPLTDTVFTPYSLARNRLRLGPGQPLPFNPYRNMYVTGTLVVGSRFYVSTQTPCAEYTVRARDDFVEPAQKRGVMRLSGDGQSIEPPFVGPGAMSHLPDGEPFARVRQQFGLGKPTQTVGSLQCYRTAVWGKSDSTVKRSLELCFDPADVVAE